MTAEIVTKTAIYFWSHNAKYKFGCFCNFYDSPFVDSSGRRFYTSEHYFMYMKCLEFDPGNKVMLEKMLTTKDPGLVKAMGRQVANYDGKKWDRVKYGHMYKALEYKFGQHANLRAILLESGTKVIYEASPYDAIWGIGYSAADAIHVSPTKYGQNLLGLALMELRSELSS